ncbi:single-stranded DNA-binding protein [Parageobacillus genomosp. 1]|uniref:Single-stranded DNA-binding protein n=1 Tax=Parageobacillus genomosp. 1 TaxID=1295642 RepID=A0ABC9VG83_9BACL|nr:single-stranded DNA-binding protein [Parageobacillus genomosp. 1]EZP77596.1 single-stranded DNA-binding protein [Parageobacillus genomosp. 1]
MNKVVLIGRLTRDAELRYTKKGNAVASFTVAVNRNKDEADFINCIAWNKVAENLANYTQKGTLIAVDGSIQTRSYEKDGQRIFVTEVLAHSVEFLSSKGKGTGEQKERNTGQKNVNTNVYGVADPLTGENSGYDDPFVDSSISVDDMSDLPF